MFFLEYKKFFSKGNIMHLDWPKIFNYFTKNPDVTLKIPTKGTSVCLPDWLHETSIGFPEGSIAQYRDNREKNSVHLRLYSDYLTIHMDKFNPEFAPIKHSIMDLDKIVRSPTFVTVALMVLILVILNSD